MDTFRQPPPAPAPLLAGLVAHWHNEAELGRLVEAWPSDPRFSLLVVDNGSSRPLPEDRVTVLRPGGNLGFAGAINLAVAAVEAPLVLLLNPDALPEPGALDALLEGFDAYPEAAGLAPRLVGPGGEAQWRWQLRPLPAPTALLLQPLFHPGVRGPAAEPAAGAPIEQPAAAALALRRRVLVELGGLDQRFFPAWFEDVDLARRLRQAGQVVRYWPSSIFRHQLGGSVPHLGYGRFLWVYYRNLERYLARHHGASWVLARGLMPLGMAARLALLPLRRPRRAPSRHEAARGLAAVIVGALSGWRRPRSYARFARSGSVATVPEPSSAVRR